VSGVVWRRRVDERREEDEEGRRRVGAWRVRVLRVCLVWGGIWDDGMGRVIPARQGDLEEAGWRLEQGGA